MMSRTYVALLHEYLEEMDELTDEEFGRLCRGLLRYSATGEVFEPTGNERFFIKHAFAQEDRHQESYERISKVRSEAGKKGMASRWGITKDNKSNQTKTDTETKIKNQTKTDSSPVLGGSVGFCMMTHAEQLRQLEREGLIGAVPTFDAGPTGILNGAPDEATGAPGKAVGFSGETTSTGVSEPCGFVQGEGYGGCAEEVTRT